MKKWVRIPVGPWPASDMCGYQIALKTLRASQKPGRYVQRIYTQFDSVMKLRAGYINAYDASPTCCLDNNAFKSDKGQLFSLVSGASTQSKLFTMMFMKG